MLSRRGTCAIVAMIAALAGCAPREARHDALPSATTALALACRTCHGGPGMERHAVDLDRLAPAEIAESLRAYRDGRREGTVMPRIARGLDEVDIEQLGVLLGRSP